MERIVRPSVSLELSQLPTVEVGREKWVVFFPILNKRTEFSSRSLEMVESGMPTPSNSGVQNTIEMNAVDVRVDEEVNAVDVRVDEEMNAVDVRVDEEVNAVDVRV